MSIESSTADRNHAVGARQAPPANDGKLNYVGDYHRLRGRLDQNR